MLEQGTMVFVWRCPDCPGVYDGEGLFFLYTDGDHRYCTCGARLLEDLAPGDTLRYRLVIPEYLKDTSLRQQLEEILAAQESIEICLGRREDRRIGIFSSSN